MRRDIGLLRRIWNRIFDHMLEERGVAEPQEKQRALSMSRLYDQLWLALNPVDAEYREWAWPLDIYADGDELFAIYSQGGLLYRVDLNVSGDTLTVGDPIQVTEAFPAVQQNRGQFFVRRQSDGRYRWVMIAATTVLNRVGQIDAAELFDSFVEEAERSGEYPRLDFYHLGGVDPEAWEFGTADYLARDGVCYIASGTFDEHPLARATIAAAEREPGRWGASIEFFTLQEAELITVQVGDDNIELKVPIYRKGRNTRISVLLELDAAGLFTTLGVSREVYRMRSDILEKLTELYGNEEEARAFLEEFEIDVDRVNQTVKEQGLIHRGKKATASAQESTDGDASADVEDDVDGIEIEGSLDEFELDEESAQAIAREVVKLEAFQSMHEALNAQSEQLTVMTQMLEAQEREIAELKKQAAATTRRLKALERTDAEKQQEWLEDRPASRGATRVTYRPRFRDAEAGEEEGPSRHPDEDDPLSSENIREKVLSEFQPV